MNAGHFSAVRQGIYAFAMAMIIGLLAACDSSTTGTQERSGEQLTAAGPQILHRGNNAEPSTLDPHQAGLSAESNILLDVFECLVTFTPEGKPRPGAAERWEASDDNQIWTFHLRDHHWSDGVPVTAEDFVAGFQRSLSPSSLARYADNLYMIANARAVTTGEIAPDQLGVRAVDDRTLEIRLAYPLPDFPKFLMELSGLYAAPLPRHVFTEHGADWVSPEHIVSNGAYRLADWRPNEFVHLMRNPHYYDADNVQIDEVYYYPTEDASAAFRRYRAGELDINPVMQPTQYLAWRDRLGSQIHNYELAITTYLSFNTRQAPFDDPRLRRAVALMLDVSKITDDVRQLGERPATSFTPRVVDYSGYTPQADFADLPQDERRAEARRLLAELGYSEDAPLSFELRFPSNGTMKRTAVAIQAMLAQDSVTVSVLGKEMKSHYADVEAGNFEATLATWGATVDDPSALLRYVHSDAGLANESGYSDPQFDALFDAASKAVQHAQRMALFAQAETLMLNAIPVFPLYHDKRQMLVADHVKGVVPNPPDVNLTRWIRLDRDKAL